jgi:hypothetical protein
MVFIGTQADLTLTLLILPQSPVIVKFIITFVVWTFHIRP